MRVGDESRRREGGAGVGELSWRAAWVEEEGEAGVGEQSGRAAWVEEEGEAGVGEQRGRAKQVWVSRAGGRRG